MLSNCSKENLFLCERRTCSLDRNGETDTHSLNCEGCTCSLGCNGKADTNSLEVGVIPRDVTYIQPGPCGEAGTHSLNCERRTCSLGLAARLIHIN